MSYTDATDQVLAVLDGAGIQAWRDDAQYEALANAIRHAIAMHIRPTIAAKDAEIAEIRIAMQRQAGAVKMLGMSHVARAETMMQHAQVLHDQSNHAALESERSANAALTADVEHKDAEIARLRAANSDLQSWFDAARQAVADDRAEIARLREALEQIARPPSIVGVYHSRAVDIARAALAPVEVGK